jgi:hypothetical protein
VSPKSPSSKYGFAREVVGGDSNVANQNGKTIARKESGERDLLQNRARNVITRPGLSIILFVENPGSQESWMKMNWETAESD